MNTISLTLYVDDAMLERVMPALEAIGNIQRDRQLTLKQAAEIYGWNKSTLNRWAVKEKRIPYSQPVENGRIFFKDSDLKAFAYSLAEKKEEKRQGRKAKSKIMQQTKLEREKRKKLDLIVM